MFDFDKHLADLAQQTVLVVGDLMLDEFVYGEVSRISPEAPTPVIAVKRTELMIGGAGNVSRNLVSLGARCIFVGVVGDDDSGGELKKELAKIPRIETHLVTDAGRATTRKVRFVSEHHSAHMLRADWEPASPIDAKAEDALIAHAVKEVAAAAAELGRTLGTKAVLVTRSEDGMTLVGEGAAVHVPAYPVRVRDVSGAGDTVVAVLAAMLAMQSDFESAMRAANAAAAVVVGKRGTATLSVAELRARILPAA